MATRLFNYLQICTNTIILHCIFDADIYKVKNDCVLQISLSILYASIISVFYVAALHVKLVYLSQSFIMLLVVTSKDTFHFVQKLLICSFLCNRVELSELSF